MATKREKETIITNKMLKAEAVKLLQSLTKLRSNFIKHKGMEHPVTVRVRYGQGWLQGAVDLMTDKIEPNPVVAAKIYSK